MSTEYRVDRMGAETLGCTPPCSTGEVYLTYHPAWDGPSLDVEEEWGESLGHAGAFLTREGVRELIIALWDVLQRMPPDA